MLSTRMQIRYVRDLLDGKQRRVDVRQLDEPWKGLWEHITRDPPIPLEERWGEAAAWIDDECPGNGIYQMLKNAGDDDPTFQSYAQIAPTLPPIRWLWPGWIPAGLLTVLAGAYGSGKSYLALDLARRVIDAAAAPDGSPLDAPSKRVIYVEAEAVPQINVQRARQWQLDLQHLYPMLPPIYGAIDFIRLDDRDQLIEMANAIQPGLIVVDSFSTISSRGDCSVDEVRPILAFLASLAEDAACAVVLTHHTRKRPAGMLPGLPMTMDDLRGSGHIIAAGRSILGLWTVQVESEFDPNGPRRLEVLKTNLGPHPPPLGVEFVALGEGAGIRLAYSTDAPQPYREPTELDRCTSWLLDLLSDGPLSPKEIVESAADEGFSRALVYRARGTLTAKIQSTVGRKSPENQWQLS